ncbi:hypothetical protein BU16DRAFT_537998 [Lophium mytilinum]|uniref:Uncharacterized protein n=1 Tax=Lophium mytilinum TaxID=390894 RepID=A0A6A6QWP7_9PEZI|nr:hypothetical protein BU16DRAFT_537998 [Lophium mytilinum]
MSGNPNNRAPGTPSQRGQQDRRGQQSSRGGHGGSPGASQPGNFQPTGAGASGENPDWNRGSPLQPHTSHASAYGMSSSPPQPHQSGGMQDPSQGGRYPPASRLAAQSYGSPHNLHARQISDPDTARSHRDFGLILSDINQARLRLNTIIWRPQAVDQTVPDYKDPNVIWRHVRDLKRAMLNITGCVDNDTLYYTHWSPRSRHDERDVEAICWAIMEELRKLHHHKIGATSWHYRSFIGAHEVDEDADATRRDRQLNWANRFRLIVSLLGRSKTLCDVAMMKGHLELLIISPYRMANAYNVPIVAENDAPILTQPRGAGEPAAPEWPSAQATPSRRGRGASGDLGALSPTRGPPGSWGSLGGRRGSRSGGLDGAHDEEDQDNDFVQGGLLYDPYIQ